MSDLHFVGIFPTVVSAVDAAALGAGIEDGGVATVGFGVLALTFADTAGVFALVAHPTSALTLIPATANAVTILLAWIILSPHKFMA